MNNISNIVVYNDGELELKVSLNEETIWLTQKQLAELFKVSKQNVSLHINNIFNEEELHKKSTVKFFLIVQKEGNREVERNIEHYNLDMIISIGYRVNSFTAIKFRQWATSILKNYIQNGYVINSDKITNERFVNLENDVSILKSQMNEVKSFVKNNKLESNQGIFYDGQVYDSYGFILDLIKQAKSQISKILNIKITIYTNTISKQLKLDFEKYSKQYDNITLKIFLNSHDRFLILDKKEIFHIGASLKDLGKKWFAFSKMNLDINELIKKLD